MSTFFNLSLKQMCNDNWYVNIFVFFFRFYVQSVHRVLFKCKHKQCDRLYREVWQNFMHLYKCFSGPPHWPSNHYYEWIRTLVAKVSRWIYNCISQLINVYKVLWDILIQYNISLSWCFVFYFYSICRECRQFP